LWGRFFELRAAPTL